MSLFTWSKPIDLSSRTTQQAILSSLAGALGAASSSMALLATQHPTWQKVGIVSSIISAIVFCLKIPVAHNQGDAEETLAKVPGIADPVMVPAHPTPDDPKAKAVTQ